MGAEDRQPYIPADGKQTKKTSRSSRYLGKGRRSYNRWASIHGLSMDIPWIIHGLSMDYPWTMHGLSMDNCAISKSIKVPYLPSDKKTTRSTLNSKIDKVPWRKVASTFLGPATVTFGLRWADGCLCALCVRCCCHTNCVQGPLGGGTGFHSSC